MQQPERAFGSAAAQYWKSGKFHTGSVRDGPFLRHPVIPGDKGSFVPDKIEELWGVLYIDRGLQPRPSDVGMVDGALAKDGSFSLLL
jgi:hypothetical protein